MSGGCFSADSLVYVVESDSPRVTAVPFDKLSPGMRVLSAQGETAVETVVRLKYSGDLYALGSSLWATPFHPVSLGGRSFFPKELHALAQREKVALAGGGALAVTMRSVSDVYVYDVVLANRSLLRTPVVCEGKEVDSVFVATWAQREKKDDVFAHDFFGSEAIVRDLQRHRDYAKGSITLDKPEFVRDRDSLRVVKLLF